LAQKKKKKGYLFSAPFRQQKLSSHLEKYLLLWKLGHEKFDERNANFLVEGNSFMNRKSTFSIYRCFLEGDIVIFLSFFI
jgi:hypothetical protein